MVSFLFLLKLPFVPELAEYVWSDDDNEKLSPEYCLSDIFGDTDCIMRAVVKAVGVAMIAGAFLNKAPMLINIAQTQSVAGLAKSSIYGEIVVLTNAFLYGLLQKLPFTSYGENFALLLQTGAILLYIWRFTKTQFQEVVLCSGLFVLYVYSCMTRLEHHAILMQSLLPIVVYSKGSQIMTIFTEKHTGNQSIITLSMNVLGTTIRVLTTIAEVGLDWNLLAGHSLSAGMNITLLSQYFYYQANTKKFWEEEDMKKKK